MTMKRTIALSTASFALAGGLAFAAGQYGPGASDTEIKIGNTMPYSGPVSAYGVIGKSEAAYFAMINDKGGVNGRKINFISRDDGYSPPKTLEQVRQLVEQDQVLVLFNTVGTPPNVAIQGYLNDKKVPQLFVGTGADRWNDPKHFPWTMGSLPSGPNLTFRFAWGFPAGLACASLRHARANKYPIEPRRPQQA